jgi:hypothetical protein
MKFLKPLLLLVFIFGASSASAQNMKNFFKDKTTIENPFALRDPFKAPNFKSEGKKERRGFSITGKGQYSNIADDDLEKLSVNNIKVIGVLIGKERRAMVVGSSGGREATGGSSAGARGASKVTVLKEGMKVGQEGAELKAILPGGIILVEKIVNVYGEEEYLETVIPISR